MMIRYLQVDKYDSFHGSFSLARNPALPPSVQPEKWGAHQLCQLALQCATREISSKWNNSVMVDGACACLAILALFFQDVHLIVNPRALEYCPI